MSSSVEYITIQDAAKTPSSRNERHMSKTNTPCVDARSRGNRDAPPMLEEPSTRIQADAVAEVVAMRAAEHFADATAAALVVAHAAVTVVRVEAVAELAAAMLANLVAVKAVAVRTAAVHGAITGDAAH